MCGSPISVYIMSSAFHFSVSAQATRKQPAQVAASCLLFYMNIHNSVPGLTTPACRHEHGPEGVYRPMYRTSYPVQDRGPCNDSEGRSLLCLASREQLAADHTYIEHMPASKSVTSPAAPFPEDANNVNMDIIDIRWTHDHAIASLGLTDLADPCSVPLADCCSSSPIT